MSILNPLALTYHFGQASATPDRKKTAEITGHLPHPTVKNHVVNREGRDNVMSEASFRDGLGVHSRKNEGGDRKPEARPTPSRREVGGSANNIYFLKAPKLAEAVASFLAERTKAVVKARFIRKKQA